MDRLLTTCAALGANGRFCAGSLDATTGTVGETRVCSAGLHRFVSDGERWTLDLTWEPPATMVDLSTLGDDTGLLGAERQPVSSAGAGCGAARASSSWTT